MKYFVFLSSLVFVCCASDSKKSYLENKNQVLLDNLYRKKLIIPNNHKKRKEYNLIYHLDLGCKNCLTMIEKYDSFLSKLHSEDVNVILIVSNYKSPNYNELKQNFSYEVVIDSTDSFKYNNKLSTSVNISSFLTNFNNQILLIGDLNDHKYQNQILNLVND